MRRAIRDIPSVPRLFCAAVLSPLAALRDTSASSWAVAFAAGFMSFLRADIIFAGLLIAIALGFFDYLLGYTRAKLDGTLDSRIAYAGMLGKFAGVVLILGTRAVEWWLQEMLPPWPDTDGLIAAVLCAALIVRELHSLNEKGVRLPIVTRALDGIESTLARLLPGTASQKEP